MNPILAVVFLLALVTTIGAAIMGWFVNMPDGSQRFRWRFVTFASAFVAQSIVNGRAIHAHDWLWFAIGCVLGMYCIGRGGYWWKRTEAARKIERRLARGRR